MRENNPITHLIHSIVISINIFISNLVIYPCVFFLFLSDSKINDSYINGHLTKFNLIFNDVI